MSKVDVIALDACNQHRPGDKFEVTEREAEQLIKKGLVKMAGPHSNKMAPEAENKANPSKAAGKARQSSASPAAPASPRRTARQSAAGGNEDKADE